MKQSNLSDLLDRIEVALYGCLASPTNGPHAALVVLAAIRREECGEESFPFSIRQRDEIAEAEARNVREELEKLIAGQKAAVQTDFDSVENLFEVRLVHAILLVPGQARRG